MSPKRFEKKSLSDELFLHFSFESSESDLFFSIIYMIRIRFFRPRERIQRTFRAAQYSQSDPSSSVQKERGTPADEMRKHHCWRVKRHVRCGPSIITITNPSVTALWLLPDDYCVAWCALLKELSFARVCWHAVFFFFFTFPESGVLDVFHTCSTLSRFTDSAAAEDHWGYTRTGERKGVTRETNTHPDSTHAGRGSG